MKTQSTDMWEELRTAYRPTVPELDTAAIMAAVRREAAARPWRRKAANTVAAIPFWACAAAASLALLASGGILVRSLEVADQQIGSAWMRSVQPEQFADAFLKLGDHAL